MKKYLLVILLVLFVFTLTGCNGSSSKEFKNEYESLNSKENASGKVHRTVNIDEDNPFVKISTDELLERIENKETFYVYFGSKLCPWCRSVIEKATEVSLNYGITKIYYIDIWDDEGNEILRDKYALEDNRPVLKQKGTDNYYKLLEVFDSLLSDYTLTDSKSNKVNVGEKRIYAPNFMYVKEGVPERLITGISEKQKDSRGELTSEILKDEEKVFSEFFAEVCDDAC